MNKAALFLLPLALLGLSACTQQTEQASNTPTAPSTPSEIEQFKPLPKLVEDNKPPQLYDDNIGPKPNILPDQPSVETDFFGESVREQELADSTASQQQVIAPIPNRQTSPQPAPAPARPTVHYDKTEMLALAEQSGCLQCHGMNDGRMGPSFRDIANRYRNQANAQSELINSVSMGSSGKWSLIFMPANSPRVSNNDIYQLTEFILSLN